MNNTYLGNNELLLTAGEPASVNYNMGKDVYGSYANLKFQVNKNDGWRKQPSNPPLKKGPMVVYQGTPLPLANEVMYQYPPKDSMFPFSYNYASPRCCPSTLSTDTGCVCTTPEQRKWIGEQRGNNKNFPNGSF